MILDVPMSVGELSENILLSKLYAYLNEWDLFSLFLYHYLSYFIYIQLCFLFSSIQYTSDLILILGITNS